VLAAAGVLKFVDQKMTYAVGDSQGSVGGRPSVRANALAICATSTKSTAPASAKTTCNSLAA